MKVYVVMERDADPYCGSHLRGVYSTRELAINSLKDELLEWEKEEGEEIPMWYELEEVEVDEE